MFPIRKLSFLVLSSLSCFFKNSKQKHTFFFFCPFVQMITVLWITYGGHLVKGPTNITVYYIGEPQINVFGLLNIWKPVSFDQFFRGKNHAE